MFSQKNKVCLITGGSRGIGFAVAERLYKDGFSIVLCSRNKKGVQVAAEKIDPSKIRVFGLAADVSKSRDVKRLVKSSLKRFGRIDILINNAGVFKPFGPFETIPFSKNIDPIEVNLIGTMRCCYEVIPVMKKQKYGRIINFCGGGIGGDIPLANAASYYTSKGAIAIFTEVLATEVKDFGITVNAVLPSQILTRATKVALRLSKKRLGPVLTKAAESLRRRGGESTKPIANLISFLVSEEARHVTGKLLSAKWDKLEYLRKKLASERYNLRRIEGQLYVKGKK